MQYIVIVFGASSAMLYVQEAIARGYKPIVVNPPVAPDSQEANFKAVVGDSAIFIDAKDMENQEDVIEELKKYDIVCIVPGAAGGVRYAEKLIDTMGFKGNGYDSLWRRDTKKGMSQSLQEAGLRYIKTIVVTKEQDIIDFFKDNKLKIAFMKLSETAASVGAKKCNSVDEAIEHYRSIKDSNNLFGWKTDILLQEYIDGTEYIVNSVSCEGIHMITDIWVYNKVIIDNHMLYESCELVMSIEPGMYDLIMYAYKVLDATGFKYGPCHGEYKVDEKGPVLIETNPRPMGASLNASYLDFALGHHISDIALDAYLDKSRFIARRQQTYRPLRKAIIKFMYAPHDMDVNMMPILEMLKCLKSFKYTNPEIEDKPVHIVKTDDLETCPLMIKLCHKDSEVVRNECKFLHQVELFYFDLLYSMNQKIPETKRYSLDDFQWMLDYIPRENKVLFCLSNEKIFFHLNKKTKIDNKSWDSFDDIIIADTREGTIGEKIAMLRREASQLSSGKYIVIVPEFYENFPYKAIMVEIILHSLDFTIEVPPMESQGIILGHKN